MATTTQPIESRIPPAAAPFLLAGAVFVVAGGLLSAATAPAASYHSSWAAAYIVLVAGVAQAVLGFGQAELAERPPSRRVVLAQLASWNAGNAAVLLGTLLSVTAVLYLGSALLLATLVSVLAVLRRARPGRALLSLRLVIALLIVSLPTGVVLQALTH